MTTFGTDDEIVLRLSGILRETGMGLFKRRHPYFAGVVLLIAAVVGGGPAQATCPTSNCLPPGIPPTGESMNTNSRYIGSIQSRQDRRLNSTGASSECFRFDATDPRAPQRDCAPISSTQERRLQ